MRRILNVILWSIGLAVVLTVYFFVPIGRRTLFEHTLRIAATEPAQELRDDLVDTGETLGTRAADEWEARRAIREDAASAPRSD